MKLIEGMKLIKELLVKADDLRKKIRDNSALLSIETPVYPDQKGTIAGSIPALAHANSTNGRSIGH